MTIEDSELCELKAEFKGLLSRTPSSVLEKFAGVLDVIAGDPGKLFICESPGMSATRTAEHKIFLKPSPFFRGLMADLRAQAGV